MTPHPPQDNLTEFGGAFMDWNSPEDAMYDEPAPNPTEEQTSGERIFEDYWATKPRTIQRDRLNQLVAHAAWDARQPEIDRLRAALERITEMHNGMAGLSGFSANRIAREALNG